MGGRLFQVFQRYPTFSLISGAHCGGNRQWPDADVDEDGQDGGFRDTTGIQKVWVLHLFHNSSISGWVLFIIFRVWRNLLGSFSREESRVTALSLDSQYGEHRWASSISRLLSVLYDALPQLSRGVTFLSLAVWVSLDGYTLSFFLSHFYFLSVQFVGWKPTNNIDDR